jgi:hypothetical protein
MAASTFEKRDIVAPFHMGDMAATQPLSGLRLVDTTRAVHGAACGNFVREATSPKLARSA